jgi:hypothetical protein
MRFILWGKMMMNSRSTFLCAVVFIAAHALPAQSQSQPTPNCRTQPFQFYPAQNDTATAVETMDAAGCLNQFRAGGKAMFTEASIVSKPHNGTLSQTGGFAFTYKPKVGFKGSDSYSLKVCGTSPQGTGCSTINYQATVQ